LDIKFIDCYSVLIIAAIFGYRKLVLDEDDRRDIFLTRKGTPPLPPKKKKVEGEELNRQKDIIKI
jgi:hypothetical protein